MRKIELRGYSAERAPCGSFVMVTDRELKESGDSLDLLLSKVDYAFRAAAKHGAQASSCTLTITDPPDDDREALSPAEVVNCLMTLEKLRSRLPSEATDDVVAAIERVRL